ncbi:MAG: carboxypeptidase-like regulatory domain-containing protein [Flaviramulus sp.]|nr:carboxypeptidase-like regulatory domain-containing protein [Flaviramulus sp.]
MNHLHKVSMFFILVTSNSFSQESINAKILDSTSQKPIPFATISINENSGVISNNNGEFLLYLNQNKSKKDSLIIRCLGYQTKCFLVNTFNDSVVLLSPKSIELNEVLISNKNYTAEEIIEKAKENLANNYDYDFIKSKVFYRASNLTNLLKKEVTIKNTTIPEFNQSFVDSLLNAMPDSADNYTEVLADMYGKSGINDTLKLDIIKASNLYDKSREITFNSYEEKFNSIIKKYVKRDSYFKIKSGVFGTKEDMDSSFFHNEKPKVDETEAFLEEQKKKEQERKNSFTKHTKYSISRLQLKSFSYPDSDLNFLEKSNRYEFELEDYSFLNNNFVCIIKFKPKRSANYKGTIYVNIDDFAIIRVDYENVKALKNFRLLGLSYNLYLKRGTFIYEKNKFNRYALKYAEVEEGNKFGIKRPLKIIEKNKHSKGRRKQNELSSDIHFIVSNIEKQELVVFENNPINRTDYAAFEEKPKVKPIYLPKYDPEFWKGYNVIEPNQAIRDFKSIE